MRKRRVISLLVLLSVVGSGLASAQPAAPQTATLTCHLGFLRVTYSSGPETASGFRGSLSFAIGDEIYPGYARLLLEEFDATITTFPVFVGARGSDRPERVLLDEVAASEADVRWVHGGICLATGEFFLYLHVLPSDGASTDSRALEPQYVRLVLHGLLRPGATTIWVEGTGCIPSGALAGTTFELRARCTVGWPATVPSGD